MAFFPLSTRQLSPNGIMTTPWLQDSSGGQWYKNAVSDLAADRTVTYPLLTGNANYVFDSFPNTFTAAQVISAAGAVSTPALLLSGAWFTGGTATTTKPQFLIEPAGTTSTAWVTDGTALGINAAANFGGRLIDAQINSTRIFRIGNFTVASAVSGTLDVFSMPANTVTITGSTSITTATGYNFASFGVPTYSAASALTITNAATLYIGGAPTGAGAGPATITNAYAIWVDAGNSRFDGQIANTYTSIVSVPAGYYSGSWFTGGTATTNKPHVLIEPTGATSTGWGTAGTGLGINAASGFVGNYLDIQIDGFWAIRATPAGGNNGVLQLRTKAGGAAGGINFFDNSAASQGGFITTGSGVIGFYAAAQGNTLSLTADNTNCAIMGLGTGSGSNLSIKWNNATFAGVEGGEVWLGGGTRTVTTSSYTNQFMTAAKQATITAANAFTITTAATLSVEGTPNPSGAGPMTITNAFGLMIGTALATIPAYSATNATTITNAASFYIAGPPATGGNVTVTNAYAIWSDAGTNRFDGDISFGGNIMPQANSTQDIGDGTHYVNGLYVQSIFIEGLSNSIVNNGGNLDVGSHILGGVSGLSTPGGGANALPISALSTAITYSNAGTIIAEQLGFSTNGRTLTITGAYATQRFNVFAQPTISAASALAITTAATLAISSTPNPTGAGPATITNAFGLMLGTALATVPAYSASNATTITLAAMLYIAGAPVTGGNVTVTNGYAMYSASGANFFGGNVGLNVVATGFGTNAAGVLGIANGTAPTTSPIDMIQLYSVDISAGNATLGLRTETAVAGDAALVSTDSLTIFINGAKYKIPLVFVP